VSSDFIFSFNAPGALEEAPSASESSSPYWFLDSGGRLLIEEGIGETVHGELPESDRWREAYALSSALDTDGGRHPQNLFRLITRSRWSDATTTVAVRIDADNLSASPNRNESNGLHLMSRYQDSDTLYYAGIRVDGLAAIKKKYRGVYYTMAEVRLFPGTYARATSPTLLPQGEWLGMRVETRDLPGGSVRLTLSLTGADGLWRPVLTAVDDGRYGGTPPITEPGALGIRTDFMDVSFKDIRITGLKVR